MSTGKTTTLRRSCRLTEKRHSQQKRAAGSSVSRNSASESRSQAPLTSDHPTERIESALNGIGTSEKSIVTRPPNAFMLFRSDFWAREKLKDNAIGRDHRDISRIAAICWNNLTDEMKAVYRRKAEEQKELHHLQHPEYKYKFSPVRRETLQRRRRSRKCGSAETERCKQLAGRAMAELNGHLREPLKSREHRVEEITDQQNSNSAEALSGNHKPGESTTLDSSTETIVDGAVTLPAVPEIITVSGSSSAHVERQIFRAASFDVVDAQFGQKPLLERYIPEIRFWYTLRSSREQVPHVDTEEGGRPVYNPRDRDEEDQKHHTIFVRDVANTPTLFAEENSNGDWDVELEKYFQFDKDDNN